MTKSGQDPSAPERLEHAYNRMMERVQSVIEQAEGSVIPTLQRNIELARNRAVELGELTRDEAEKIGAYPIERELGRAHTFLAYEEQRNRSLPPQEPVASEEEHAVSTHTDGPRIPNVYDTRPHSTLKAEATPEYVPGVGSYTRHMSAY